MSKASQRQRDGQGTDQAYTNAKRESAKQHGHDGFLLTVSRTRATIGYRDQ
ncbi:MAG TPA: hypothetical protein VE715_06105 [Blastocatellia bacterium]|nr:hypothetical protein [Blastocatellia bacterium]